MKNKIISFTGFAIVLIGISLLAYSFTLDRYTDVKAYNERYSLISSTDADASEQFATLRDDFLTSKFALENYGLTALIVGALILVIAAIGYRKLKSPSKRIWIILVGLCASILICLAFMGELYLELYRGSYPHWADTLSIPIMSTSLILLVLILWTGLISIWMQGPFISGVRLLPLNIPHSNTILLIILILTAMLLLYLLVTGSFWMIIPGACWIYFYMSIIQGKSQAKHLI